MRKDSFKLVRFAQTLKLDIVGNAKTYAFQLLVLYGLLFIGLLIIMLDEMKPDQSFDMISMMFALWTTFVGVCGGIFYASLLMKPFSRKQARLSYLMLPASNLEKFLSRALIVTVGFWAIMIIALLGISATYYLLAVAFGYESQSYGFLFADVIGRWMSYRGDSGFLSVRVQQAYMFAQFAVLFCAHALFVVSSCLWRRHAFAKMLGCLIVFNFVVSWIVPRITSLFPINLNIDALSIGEVNEMRIIMLFLFGCLNVVVGLLFWWGSYRLFTRAHV